MLYLERCQIYEYFKGHLLLRIRCLDNFRAILAGKLGEVCESPAGK